MYRHWGGIQKQEREYSFDRLQKSENNTHVWVTTYEGLKSLMDGPMKYIQWGVCVMDESQKIKNPNAGLKAAFEVQAQHRILVSGTPIHNSPYELYTSLQLMDPTSFSNERMNQYVDTIVNLRDAMQVQFTIFQNNIDRKPM